jgi:alpha-L-rhamnosidase
MRISRIILTAGLALSALGLAALPAETDEGFRHWTASWIVCPDGPVRDAGVFHFRKRLTLERVPTHFIVHVSGDSQFLLFVNERRVGSGPARGDLAHWRFETYDLAPFLRAGTNVLAATVWNFGEHSAIAQMSDRTGFLLQGDTAPEQGADTNESWEAEQENGITASGPSGLPADAYFAAEPSERMDAPAFDWLWNTDGSGGPNSRWKKAVAIGKATSRGQSFPSTKWELVPDALPAMAMELAPVGRVVRVTGIDTPSQFPDKGFLVPAHASASVLIDTSHLTTAYPELTVGGGAGSSIRVTYAEALYDDKGNKGNRNEIAGKHIVGLRDEFLPDGATRTFVPLTWKTWRFLQLDITTANEALQVERLRAWFTAYPFEQRGRFDSEDSSLDSIWEIGWRTARLDAHDTYMDTPYWERLQYVGDTRIQALISYTVAGDDRLARQAIEAINDSRIPDGITQSRYPSSLPQYIPTFSLLWIGMVHDFYFYRDDADFVRAQLGGTRTVLDWYLQRQRADGLLQRLPWWVFVDWAEDFHAGEPPQDADGGSSIISLQFIEALRYAADLEDAYGDRARSEMYRQAMNRAVEGVRKLCWNEKYGLLADTPAQNHFSQHANILGVWLDVIPQAKQRSTLAKLLSGSGARFAHDSTLPAMSQATYYFRFYLARALQHAGMGQEYIPLLQPWRDMLALGLTTWAEQPEPTRSDSHAWSAHPNYDLLTIVAGIRPGSPGFRTVTIEPNVGELQHVAATMEHPGGEIKVEFTRQKNSVDARVSLPLGVSGTLRWGGKNYALHEGAQRLELARAAVQ